MDRSQIRICQEVRTVTPAPLVKKDGKWAQPQEKLLIVVYDGNGDIVEAYKPSDFNHSSFIKASLKTEGYVDIWGTAVDETQFQAMLNAVTQKEVLKSDPTVTRKRLKSEKYIFTDEDYELIDKYHSLGIERQMAWSLFVKDKHLNPGCDAKDFYAEFAK